MPEPTASVALCTFNGAHFLDEQLNSIAAQTLAPIELVVGDDGSSDDTPAMVERFAARAPFPVRLLRHPRRLGYRANFMATAAACSGDIVFFSDQDDVWSANKIEQVMRAFADDPQLLLAYHDAVVTDADGNGDERLFDAPAQREILARQPMPVWHYTLGFTQAFRRELLRHQALWPASRDHMSDEVMAHDQWYLFLAALLGRVGFVEAPLVRHRQHGTNTYGVRAISRWRRIASRFSHNPEWDRLAAVAADRRADAAEALAGEEPGNQRLRTIADGYRALARRHARRHTAYLAPTIAGRAGAFATALRAGDYGGRPWGLEPKAIARDAVLGVLRGGAA